MNYIYFISITTLIILTIFFPKIGVITYIIFLFLPGLLILNRLNKRLSFLEKLTLSFALSSGLLVALVLILNILDAVNRFIILLFFLIITFFAFYFTKTPRKIKTPKQEYIILILTILVPILVYSFQNFPSTDFWFTYHHLNVYIEKWLLPLGNIIAWSPLWYLGSPIFYSPVSLALIHTFTLISGINIVFSELLVNALAYIFLIFSITIFIKKYVGIKTAYITSILLIFSGRIFNEIFIQGHYATFFALGYSILALYSVFNKHKYSNIFFVLFMFLSLLSHHTIFIIFNIPLFLYYLFTSFKQLKSYVIKILIAIMLGSFWLLPTIYESFFWLASDTARSFPDPVFMYISSYFIFFILAIAGLYYCKKQRGWFLPTFIITFIVLSLISAYIFPLIPGNLEDQLRKILFLGFKSTFLTNVFIPIFIAFVIVNFLSVKKYKIIGYLMLTCYILYGIFLINIFIQQETLPIKIVDGIAYRDSNEERIFLDNKQVLKSFIAEDDLNTRNNVNLIISTLLNSPTTNGFPGPKPIRSNYFDDNSLLEYAKFTGAKIFITKTELSDDFTLVYKFDPIIIKEYDTDLDYLKTIIKNPFKYIISPDEYPSRQTERIWYMYIINKPRDIIEVPKFEPVQFYGTLDKDDVKNGLYNIPIILNKEEISGISQIVDKSKITFTKTSDLREVEIVEIKPNKIKVETNNINKMPLYIKFNYSPHWKAYVDNNKIDLYRTFTDLMYVEIPENSEILELRWERTMIDYLSYIISLLGLLSLILFIK